MILISHRGNIIGKTGRENHPTYIDEAIQLGYDVEIDIRVGDINTLWLGHDTPDFPTDLEWLKKRKDKLWIHCKNHKAVEYFWQMDSAGDVFNYFWHNDDDMTITSKGIIWSHPKIPPLRNSISVLPDNYKWDLSNVMGICSDYIDRYKK